MASISIIGGINERASSTGAGIEASRKTRVASSAPLLYRKQRGAAAAYAAYGMRA